MTDVPEVGADLAQFAPDQHRLRVRNAGDLLGLVPYLLGFHPSESLVVLLLREGRLILSARVDLLTGISRRRLVADYRGRFRRIIRSNAATGVVLIGYSRWGAPARELTSAVADALGDVGLVDALYVEGDRWWSLTCPPGCCPPDGRPYDPGSAVLAAEAVYSGLSAEPDRAALARRVEGPAVEDVGRLADLATRIVAELAPLSEPERVSTMGRLVGTGLHGRPLGDADRLRLAVLAADLKARDFAWATMDRLRAAAHLELWLQVVASAPPAYAAGPLCLVGMAAWISGNGALQVCALTRVQAIAPRYTMAGLLAELNDRAVPPSVWDELAPALRAVAASQERG